MPLPADIRDIVLPSPAQITAEPHHDPFFQGWAETYGRYEWFRIKCYRDCADLADLALMDIQDPKHRKNAVEWINGRANFGGNVSAWKAMFTIPSSLNRNDRHWASIGASRIATLYNGIHPRAGKMTFADKTNGVSFPAAVLALLCLDLAVRDENGVPRIDIYERVRICPIIYKIQDFDEAQINSLSPANKSILYDDALQKKYGCIGSLAKNVCRPVSYDTAARLQASLTRLGSTHQIEVEGALGQITKVKKPNTKERIAC